MVNHTQAILQQIATRHFEKKLTHGIIQIYSFLNLLMLQSLILMNLISQDLHEPF